MFKKISYGEDLTKNYETVIAQLDALSDGIMENITILSNASALLAQFLDDINWVGFYLYKNDKLILGPFMGLPACVEIKSGSGVCGTAVVTRSTQLVPNVHEFPGHIACDSITNSEIVIPIIINNEVYGVLDIDSPSLNRFTEVDKEYLEKFTTTLVKHLQQNN